MKRLSITNLGISIFSLGLLAGCPGDDTPIGEGDTSSEDEIGSTDTTTTTTDTTADTESTSSGDTTDTADTTDTTTTDTTTTDTTTDTTGDTTTDTGTDTGPGGILDEIPPEEWEPIPNPDGVPAPNPGVYDDQGEADPNDSFRALIGLWLREQQALEDFTLEVSDPQSAIYGDYMSLDEFLTEHAPLQHDFDLLQAWIEYEGMSVNYLASNRMLIQFSGTVGQFNEAFDTVLHVCMRKNPQQGNPPIPVYCTDDSMTLPIFVANRSPGIVTADLPAEVGQLPGEGGNIEIIPPNGATNGSRLTPARVAKAYDIDDMYAMGYDGSGQTIGVIMGASIHFKWLQTFWQSFGVVRTNPEIYNLMEPPVTRYVEAQLDNAWSGVVAPGANMIGYACPDAKNTAMVFCFNEAATRAQGDGVSVLTDSFAHREDSEPPVVRNQYNDSALVGAALGITICAATGDSARTDTPSSSPWVTGVGGTRMSWSGNNLVGEIAWDESGSGETLSFAMPDWQVAVAGELSNKRMTADVSAAASPWSPYWVYYNSQWLLYGGTSFSSPVFAGMIAVINQYRAENGMDPVGYLNQLLYTEPVVQASFRDITSGATDLWAAGPGWDPVTGWGVPSAPALAAAVP